MKFLAKATGLNGLAVWKGFYAEMKDGNEKTPVIIDVTEGVPHKIIPTTLKWCTGIQTGKAQDIFEGDQVEVWNQKFGKLTQKNLRKLLYKITPNKD